MSKPKLRIPHVFVLLAGVILLCSLATFVVPSGRYDRVTRDVEGHERTLLVPGTYRHLDKLVSAEGVLLGRGDTPEDRARPVGLHGFLTAIPRGLEKQADIIFFIFVVGGVFGILQRTGVITAGLRLLLDRFGRSGALLTVVIMSVLALGGSTLGMGEEFIPLVPVFLLVSKRLGYDRIFGLALVIVAAQVGFAASTTNPFTVLVAQGIGEVPLLSGLWFRWIFLAVCLTTVLVYTLRYGARVKADPAASLMAGDAFDLDLDDHDEPFAPRHAVILTACTAIFAFILFATVRFGWWMSDMAGGFLLMGLVAAAVGRLPVDEAAAAFVDGMRDMVVAAMVVGFARGIEVVLSDGQIMDTVVHSAAVALQQVPRHVAAVGMLVFQSTLNLLIPSGSGQAAVTMPLMAPLSDLLGLTRQTAVFAFTCGDGFSNSIIPTSGILMSMLALARIPYVTWLRFMVPLFLILMGWAVVFLLVAVGIGYSG
ncbi:MAG TPA: AbgT family transporter [Candidatus Krumholzibacteria bacterium]|nr:AbgT family transporter [Candidatus Krumholzibacteria bacterium]HRX51976.1 AbgT family transporter [Candidatus Krumholzibacteria bacterium]